MTTLLNLDIIPKSQSLFLYGTISCGADTWSSSLGKGRQVFSYDSRLRSEDTLHRTNYQRTNWSKYPNLDLLLVHSTKMDKLHDKWMNDWGHPTRAKHILVIHGPQALTAFNGKGFKSWSKVIRGRGYETHTWHMDAIQCGSAIYSSHLATFCFPGDSPHQLPLQLPIDKTIRPCRKSNQNLWDGSDKIPPTLTHGAFSAPNSPQLGWNII